MRPRYGRIATLSSSLVVTVVAVVGGAGLLPSSADDVNPAAAVERTSGNEQGQGAGTDSAASIPQEPDGKPSAPVAPRADNADPVTESAPTPAAGARNDTGLPSGSGEGKRVVFSESRQRVWLVDEASQVVRTYPVSGSVYDNLDPGTFQVYSRSEDAFGIDNSGTMKYFVRFTTGDEGAAIGFHDIPVDEGELVQSVADLGTPLSHGCIRQQREDAIVLWEFAPIGTTVVVTE
jgi:lipoprotein-anchoring transpeptidase ErfK/SrfK